ncbi:hypothetical protein C5O28_04080 [Limosilactobacillus fermentum]|nr:hypothetical protein C5O28_04080 [Limosilactobacillus fermentum]
MDCVVTPLKTLMGFSVHLNVQLKFYNLPSTKIIKKTANFFKKRRLCNFVQSKYTSRFSSQLLLYQWSLSIYKSLVKKIEIPSQVNS